MVVQHNLQAMNANRMLGINAKANASSTEKLSSGYRVNRAADDAAGLAISEKMRKQIRGLTQASSNAEDGVSAVQTAEGALAEIQDMLQRMNELCVQAANGTNSMTDRQYIQDELDQLVTEIDRVSETTKFNELYLLKGDEEVDPQVVHTFNYRVDDEINPASQTKVATNGNGDSVKVEYNDTENLYLVPASAKDASSTSPVITDVLKKGDDYTKYLAANGTEVGVSSSITDITFDTANYIAFKNTDLGANPGLTSKDGKIYHEKKEAYIYDTEKKNIIHLAEGEDLSAYIDVEGDKTKSYKMNDRYRLLAEADGEDTAVSAPGGTLGEALGDRELSKADFKGSTAERQLYDADGKSVTGMALYKYFDEKGEYKGGLFSDKGSETSEVIGIPDGKTMEDAAKDPTSVYFYVSDTGTKVAGALEFSLHVGADSELENKIYTRIATMSSAGIGINKLSSDEIGIVDETGDNATAAIDVVASALQAVSTQRSILGAIQNRLEHTIKNLDNVVENTTSAESSIRDTDMAEEMVEYSNNNVLLQAGQSMLAQANQANQGVLSLLG